MTAKPQKQTGNIYIRIHYHKKRIEARKRKYSGQFSIGEASGNDISR